jgi:uncharacterized protein YecE (DUF72 family)
LPFYLGCAVWAFKGWVGDFYPKSARSGNYLGLYSQRFSAVEGNTTFYVIPDRQTIQRWITATPDTFRFCLKLPRDFSHAGLLTPHLPQAIAFLELVKDLGDRLANVFIQLPPTYSPSLIEDLAKFLSALKPVGIPLALEVRHPDWFKDPSSQILENLLRSLSIARVLLDSRPIYDLSNSDFSGSDFSESGEDPQLHSQRRKPKLPLSLSMTTDFCVVRFISHPDSKQNHPFLQAWTTQIAAWLAADKTVYFFVHCPQEGRSPHNARELQRFLEAEKVSIPALPWDQVALAPNQLSLF